MRFTALLVLSLLLSLAPDGFSQEAKEVGTDITVELRNGDRITGKLVEQTASEIVLDNEYVGIVRILRDAIQPPPPPEEEPDMVEIKSPWSGSFDLSIAGKRGNTQEQNTFVEFKARRETERTIDTYRATYERNLQEIRGKKVTDTTTDPDTTKKFKTTDTTDRRVTGEARREWFLKETKWRPFIQGSFDDDKFKAYKRRYRIGTGVAYPWIENEKERWIGRVGAAGVKDQSGDDTDWRPEALLGMDYFLQVNDAQSFSAGTEVYPGLQSGQGYQSITRAEYRMKVVAGAPWTIKIGAEQDRNSKPDAGDSKNDLTYYFAAGFVF